MIPYKPHLATLVPQTAEVRLEIIKAISTLAAQSHEERVRLRQAEVASLRGELEAIDRDLRKLCRDWPLLIRSELRKAGFDPMSRACRRAIRMAVGGRATAPSPPAIQKLFPMRPILTGYPAPNTPPTATIAFQERSTESIRFSRRP